MEHFHKVKGSHCYLHKQGKGATHGVIPEATLSSESIEIFNRGVAVKCHWDCWSQACAASFIVFIREVWPTVKTSCRYICFEL